MKVLGIIAEYNPFHNGHKYHLEISKKLTKAEFIVCVMSGNFIQRGEPALLNKWSRTKMALANGVDLVIELPVSYSLQSAEFFAFGSVKILDSLNIVTDLCFGSEWENINHLQQIASVLANEPVEFSEALKKFVNNGENYAKARENALISYSDKKNLNIPIKNIIAHPNNILGIEYLKALYKLNSSIQPSSIQRYKTGYSSLQAKDNIASATAVRQMLQSNSDINKVKNLVPSSSYEIFKEDYTTGKAPVFSSQFENSILTLLRKLDQSQLASYPDVNEGLENRIKNASMNCGTLEQLISSIKTKRYTQTRLQRIMFNILLDIKKEQLNRFQNFGGPQYIRVLGMNSNGKKLLKEAKQKANLPIITKPAFYKQSCNPLLKQMMELDFLATDLYTLGFPCPNHRKGKLDYLTSPIII